MGQVTIYLEDEVEKKMVDAAKSAHLSKSKWIARLIKEEVATEWPQSIINLNGAWGDFPDIGDIRGKIGKDSAREEL
ncbi:MAG: CopG family transcriptional regulator [Moraxellaceae bacterium]|nr:MAG: CopG family transcriptional regulator [Moraxellaceae bacterium]